jgi:hypothetical protein
MPLCSSVQNLWAQERSGIDVSGLKPEMAHVYRSEEKGSDVNLAAHLVHDANQTEDTFEVALVVSSDEDLAGAIGIVTEFVKKPVYVCRPNPRARTRNLDRAATSAFDLPPSLLRSAAFPDELTDRHGTIVKPHDW